MILSEQVYKIIRNTLVTAGVTAYSDYIPDETSYPFCMYEILSMEPYPDWAFEKDYERLTVRFNIYGNEDNPQDAINIAEQLEELFNRVKYTFVDTSDGKYLICNCKVDDSVGYLEEDTYWVVKSDYEFIAQRNIP